MSLSEVDHFEKGKYPKKYVAIMKNGKKVSFGHQDYQHYKDQVPIKMGGGIWKNLDHLDPDRRKNYRTRHGGVKRKDGSFAYKQPYTPAWFSYYYLW